MSEATLRALLAAMHVQTGDNTKVQRALYERESATWRVPLPPALVVRESALPARFVVRFPEERDADEIAWRLVEENGQEHSAVFVFATLPEARHEEEEVDQQFVARRLTLDAKPAPGYHRLLLSSGQQVLAETLLIVAPDAYYQPEAVREDGRTWGPAVQLYTVRSERNWGMGDLTDLRLLLEQWAQRGADVVGLNPLHALFPHNPDASPYSPSSRLFLNSLYVDPEHIDDFRECEEARELVYSEPTANLDRHESF